MKHPKRIERYSGNLAELAIDVGGLSYDSLAEFLGYLGEDLSRQAKADKGKGRPKLSSELEASAVNTYEARQRIINAWKICEPRMPKE
jgi:hypothetical protein